jgi:hypothetical protein
MGFGTRLADESLSNSQAHLAVSVIRTACLWWYLKQQHEGPDYYSRGDHLVSGRGGGWGKPSPVVLVSTARGPGERGRGADGLMRIRTRLAERALI